jgi:hypothetical protein
MFVTYHHTKCHLPSYYNGSSIMLIKPRQLINYLLYILYIIIRLFFMSHMTLSPFVLQLGMTKWWQTYGAFVKWQYLARWNQSKVLREHSPVLLSWDWTHACTVKSWCGIIRCWLLTCNQTCASDLATVYRFLCFTCSKLLIRSIAANIKHMPQPLKMQHFYYNS